MTEIQSSPATQTLVSIPLDQERDDLLVRIIATFLYWKSKTLQDTNAFPTATNLVCALEHYRQHRDIDDLLCYLDVPLPLRTEFLPSLTKPAGEVVSSEEKHAEEDHGQYHDTATFSFTLRGHITVSVEDEDDDTSGWVEIALGDAMLAIPEPFTHYVEEVEISTVDNLDEEQEDSWA